MRRFKFFSNSQISGSAQNSATSALKQRKQEDEEGDLRELKILMDLRKTSGLFKEAARDKIKNVMEKLAKKP